MKFSVIAVITTLLLAGCIAQPSPQPQLQPMRLACPDGGAAQLSAGIAAYNSRDLQAAFRNLRTSADCGNQDAQVNLGYIYARGEVGGQPNQQEALHLYKLSAAQGNGEGMNAIGYKYQFGTGVAPDIGTAVRWYCKAVAKGNGRALNNLAILYDHGIGVPQNSDAARDLWRQAGEHGHSNGFFNLGLSYIQGPGKLDPKQGEQFLIQAARAGNMPAQVALRRSGYKEPLPPSVDESRAMVIQPVNPSPGHAPVCDGALIS
jgi:hypothetical protein